MNQNKKKAPIGFKRGLVSLFFNNLDDLEGILAIIEGFKTQSFDLDEFYWMNPELNPTEEDIRGILKKEANYDLPSELIESYLSTYKRYFNQNR